MEKIDYRTEITAGITIFFTTMYIIVVNPAIMAPAGFGYNASLTATVLVTAFSSIAMGLYAKNPIVVAPGMGLNAFIAHTIMHNSDISPSIALGAIFLSGVVFLMLSILNIRSQIVKAIPVDIRHAAAVGIGIFISVIGFINAGFIVKGEPISSISFKSPIVITFLVSLFIVTALQVKKVKGAFIIGIIIGTLLAWPIGRWYGDASEINFGVSQLVYWKGLIEAPDFSLFFTMDLMGAIKWTVFPLTFGILFADLFDSIGTFVGVAEACDLKDENGLPRNLKKSLIVDSLSSISSGLMGTSPGTAYIESASGIQMGGKTGLTSIVAGMLFLPFIFFSPILSIVPAIATAPVLILVGAQLFRPILSIRWLQIEHAIPALITLIIIPYSYSITQGIIWGLLFHSFIKILTGNIKEIPITLWIIDAFIIVLLIIS